MTELKGVDKFLLEGNTAGALHFLLTEQSFDPAIGESYFAVLRLRLQAGDRDGADRLADKLYRFNVGDDGRIERVANVFIEVGDHQLGLKYLQCALTVNFTVPSRHVSVAYCYEKEGAIDIAIFHLQLALHFSNFDRDVLKNLIISLRKCGRHFEADGYCLLAMGRLSDADLLAISPNLNFAKIPNAVGTDLLKLRLDAPPEVRPWQIDDEFDPLAEALVAVVRSAGKNAKKRALVALRLLGSTTGSEGVLNSAIDTLFTAFDLDAFSVFQEMAFYSNDWSILARVCRKLLASEHRANAFAVIHAELCHWESLPRNAWRYIHPIWLEIRNHVATLIGESVSLRPFAAAPNTGLTRIMIIQSQLRGYAEHSVLRLVFDHAIAILRVNPEAQVAILSTDEVVPAGYDDTVAFRPTHEQIIAECVKDGDGDITKRLTVIYCHKPSDSDNYVEAVLQSIDDYAPHCVINYHGTVDDSFIFSNAIYKKYPFIYHQTNILQRPRYDSDLCLSNGQIVHQGHPLPHPERWVNGVIGFTPFKKQRSYDKSELAFGHHSSVMVTVGNRLPIELQENFCGIALRALNKHKDLAWVLVGPINGPIESLETCAKNFPDEIRQRIYHIPFEKDLRALYEHCSIYLNAFRAGGGTSISLAISEALPINCLTGCDIEMALPPEEVSQDLESYEARLQRLIEDPENAKRIGAYCREWFADKVSVENGARHLLECASIATGRFEQRREA